MEWPLARSQIVWKCRASRAFGLETYRSPEPRIRTKPRHEFPPLRLVPKIPNKSRGRPFQPYNLDKGCQQAAAGERQLTSDEIWLSL